ncbi:unnamed protein product, partial [Medioppia subpectinata]
GFTVSDSLKGIVLEGASHNVIDNVEVKNIKQEGVHFRWGSSDNVLKNSKIHLTGRGTKKDQGFGEGVYIGQAVNNWQGGQPDKSDRNQVLNNHIGPDVAAECIDIKEGSCCGVIKGNYLDGHGETGENYSESWVTVKGDYYDVQDNTGTSPKLNGFDIYRIAKAGVGGCHNTIMNNKCNGIPAGGHCTVNTMKNCGNIVQG